MVKIKFENDVDSCYACPFSVEKEEGYEASRTGVYYQLSCTKTGDLLKTYFREEYVREDFTVEVPINCPFRN